MWHGVLDNSRGRKSNQLDPSSPLFGETIPIKSRQSRQNNSKATTGASHRQGLPITNSHRYRGSRCKLFLYVRISYVLSYFILYFYFSHYSLCYRACVRVGFTSGKFKLFRRVAVSMGPLFPIFLNIPLDNDK
ncbi:hypothetical protein B0I35DRAFT_81947 [Stachybotrys elegans]|uniref:Transmembrane protein n=1 Tax=Stachybotrys elegans TaxID=80388 RepID=A0A8K0SJ12_9HYPO|nr:hypothetical protein B0I35DRAFT_81947 [Stachybotrys elegans]